jgi:glycosyltransferase involved in cell wall biosynthesis
LIHTPRVSVLLPVFNAAATLNETIESIRTQTLNNFELIIINDGSTDCSNLILDELAKKDSRLHIFHRPHTGLVESLNFGITECRGKYIARMDADDRMHPQRLQLQLEFLENNSAICLVASQVKLFSDQPLQAGWQTYIDWQNQCISEAQITHQIYWEAPFAHPSVMLHRKQILALGAYRSGHFPEDYELWLRMHAAGLRMAKLPQILLEWREHPQRLTHTDPRCSDAAFANIRLDYLAHEPRLNSGRDLAIWGAGRQTRKRLEPLLKTDLALWAWIDIDPKKIGNRLSGVPVLSPESLKQLLPKPFILVAVRNHGAQELIRSELESMGYQISTDFIPVG